jgi:hypothetical protein
MVEVIEVTQPVVEVIGGVAVTELAYVSGSSDVVVGSGLTATVLQATVVITTQTQLLVRCSVPTLEFTNTNGGIAVAELVVAGVTYPLARLASDRAFSWPATLTRKVPVASGNVTLTFQIRSVSNPCTAHAGAGYGESSMRVIA